MKNMDGIKLQPELSKAISDLGFDEWTEIQIKTIPLIQQGLDLIGQSKTGSGKTVAFGFPVLEKVVHNQGIQCLVLVPTRELCEQVITELRKFSKYKKLNILPVYGGVSMNFQVHNIPKADIIVGTPGRTLDHLDRRTLRLDKVKILVLDEADKMFEMGFIDDIKKIISYTPKQRQTLLFSATISKDVYGIAKHYMKDPQKIKAQSYVEETLLTQYYYNVNDRDKFSLLVHLLKKEYRGVTIIFCATRNRVDQLSRNLYKQGIQSQKIHGGLSQNRRKDAMQMFHEKKTNILVASDVAARGLDIKDVNHIINYDTPKTSKEYIHRIGRTARAGSKGNVVSLISGQDHDNFRRVLEDPAIKVERLETSDFERVPFILSHETRTFHNKGPHKFHGHRTSRTSNRNWRRR
ncbi:MAG: DEAD/DEAH box helicase [Nanoarchaeota archaeon]